MREKCYVEVIVDVDADGRETPLSICWEDGRKFRIARVTERRYAASMKVGGHGMRYTVLMEGAREPRFLWHDDHAWYVERIVSGGQAALQS